jgi:hypothetical protein
VETYVTASEVSTLKHELRNHAVEFAALVAEALLAGAEGTEVLGSLWDNVVKELEVDATGALYHMPKSASSWRLRFHPLNHRHAIEYLQQAMEKVVLPLSDLSRLVTLPLASHVASGPVQVQSL